MSEFDRMVKALDLAWTDRSDTVICLVGPPGIGKTSAVLQHAENVHAGKVVKLILSQCLPSEISGITMPDKDTHTMDVYDDRRLASLEDGDILFFDELLEADQMILSACLTLIESRELMSGRKLPDVQIVAATNPTLKPEQIKDNIKQRFLWMNFEEDVKQTKDYIENVVGCEVPDEILSAIETTSHRYNILTPRSLTKLYLWMNSTPDEDRNWMSNLLDTTWGSSIGSRIWRSFQTKEEHDRMQARKNAERKAKHDAQAKEDADQVKQIVQAIGKDEDEFENCTLFELSQMLSSDPNWEHIREILGTISAESPEDVDQSE